MSLRVRQVQLTAATADATFGRAISFADGLNDPSRQHTWEIDRYAVDRLRPRSQGTPDSRHDVPLPPAMTHTLRDENGVERAVSESFVIVEIENGRGETLTCQRWVRHERMDRHLVRTWRGPRLPDTAHTFEQADYFVRRPGLR